MGDMSKCSHGGYVGYCEICSPYEVHESGPWEAQVWPSGRIVIQSEDFTHDAALEVTGDFVSKENLLEYAQEIARRLNSILTVEGKTV